MTANMSTNVARIHSYQTMGTLDGPGVRFVIFMQGCPFECAYCHNPDTWDKAGERNISIDNLKNAILRYRPYFGADGGITVSGGEPLLQADFLCELFKFCKNEGINTALDTSGGVINEKVYELLNVTDLCILDYKFICEDSYSKYTKINYSNVVDFLEELDKMEIKTWIRQVVLPGINDSAEELRATGKLKDKYKCIEKIELLPFRSMCRTKYDELGMEFAFRNQKEPDNAQMQGYYSILNN